MRKLKDLKKTFTRNYLLLVLGNSTSKLGTIIYQTILAWWVIEKTNSAKSFGYISFASLLPTVLFSFFSGVIVDKFNRKKLLIIADLISGITCIAVAYIAFIDVINIPLLIIASFLLGTSSSIFSPTVKAILPEIVDENGISSCNSVTSTIGQIISVCAPMLSGVLLNRYSIGIAMIFLLNGISFLISAFCENLLIYSFIKTDSTRESYLSKLKGGFSYLRRDKFLMNLLIVSALVNIFIASYNILLPLYFKSVYYDNGLLFSNSLTFEAIGGIVGGMTILLSKNKTVNKKMLAFNLFLCGLSIMGIQIIINKYVVFISTFLFGLFLTRFNVLFFSLVQTTVKKDMLGRVFSFIIMISLSTMPISNLIFGYLGDYILNYVYIISGLGMCLASFLSISKSEITDDCRKEIV